MQLAGLLDPAAAAAAKGRSWGQKWDQAQGRARTGSRLEQAQILEAYLNLASYRGELQGVGAAARGLFGKAPSGPGPGESAILASLLRAPARRAEAGGAARLRAGAELNAATCAAIEWQVEVAMGRRKWPPACRPRRKWRSNC
jgi:penicillin-binding protein 1C